MLFGISDLKGVSLPAPSTSKNYLKILRFQVEDFYRGDFWLFNAQNAANPLLVCEYFNEEKAKIVR